MEIKAIYRTVLDQVTDEDVVDDGLPFDDAGQCISGFRSGGNILLISDILNVASNKKSRISI